MGHFGGILTKLWAKRYYSLPFQPVIYIGNTRVELPFERLDSFQEIKVYIILGTGGYNLRVSF